MIFSLFFDCLSFNYQDVTSDNISPGFVFMILPYAKIPKSINSPLMKINLAAIFMYLANFK